MLPQWIRPYVEFLTDADFKLDIEAEENSSQITNLITGLELIRLEIEHTQGVNHWKGRIESHLGTEVESLLLHTQDALCAQCLA